MSGACVRARALDHCCCFIHCTDGTFVMVLRIQYCAIAVGQTLILLSSSHVVAEERNLGIQIQNMFLEPKVLTRRRNLKMDTRSYTRPAAINKYLFPTVAKRLFVTSRRYDPIIEADSV